MQVGRSATLSLPTVKVVDESELNLHWKSAAMTHVGKVRKVNEDSCLERPEVGLWVVADGMGGHAAGDLASQWVVESLQELEPPLGLGAYVREVSRCLKEVNQRLLQEAARRGQAVIGSTVVVLLAWRHHCVYLWAGDSRAYLLRNDRLRLLNWDHSPLEDFISRGLVTREEAESYAGSNAITRAVGAADELELDCHIQEVMPGDCFLLCSDGLYKEVEECEMEALLRPDSPYESVTALTELALSRTARDNVTVIVACPEGDERSIVSRGMTADNVIDFIP